MVPSRQHAPGVAAMPRRSKGSSGTRSMRPCESCGLPICIRADARGLTPLPARLRRTEPLTRTTSCQCGPAATARRGRRTALSRAAPRRRRRPPRPRRRFPAATRAPAAALAGPPRRQSSSRCPPAPARRASRAVARRPGRSIRRSRGGFKSGR
ncbi:hypothetical protein M885DRAFT_236917 [Pelagophyceae sp. CCMP2097]|nr:hypothetical protein M885DRAFT_236917 [Pelagophyceae sp. CCMP2097]